MTWKIDMGRKIKDAFRIGRNKELKKLDELVNRVRCTNITNTPEDGFIIE